MSSFQLNNVQFQKTNIRSHHMEGHQKFLGGGGSLKSKLQKQSMKLNWDFPRGRGCVGEVQIISGTAQYIIILIIDNDNK